MTPCMISVASYADADYRICANFRRMLEHALERILSSVFTQLCEKADVATYQGLERRANGSNDRSGTDHNSAYQTKIGYDPIAVQLKGRCHHIVSHPSALIVRHVVFLRKIVREM